MTDPVVVDVDQITNGLSNLALRLKETSKQLNHFADGILEVMNRLLQLWLDNERALNQIKDELIQYQYQLKSNTDRRLVLSHLHFLSEDNLYQRQKTTEEKISDLELQIALHHQKQNYICVVQEGLAETFVTLGRLVMGIKTPEDRSIRKKLATMIKATLVIGGKAAVNTLFGFNVTDIVDSVVK